MGSVKDGLSSNQCQGNYKVLIMNEIGYLDISEALVIQFDTYLPVLRNDAETGPFDEGYLHRCELLRLLSGSSL